jgi:hypothetical protein
LLLFISFSKTLKLPLCKQTAYICMYLATKILIFVIVLCEGTLLIEAGKTADGCKKNQDREI